MNKKLLLSLALLIAVTTITFAQTKEELQAQKAEKQAEADKFQGEADALQAQIDALPGWKVGAFGTIGGSLSKFNEWYGQGTPDLSSGNIGITLNVFANKIEEKYFWRNGLNINLGWVKLDDRNDNTDDDTFNVSTDVFNLTSLYGFNIGKNIAVSALGEYRTSLLQGSFNDPGYLDLGVGATWTPAKDLVVVVHPLNYNFVFSDSGSEYESSLGAKIVADYTRQLGAVSFKTNFSSFLSYKDTDLSNWQWTNSFGYTLWKAIGVGFDFGLRGNKQETFNAEKIANTTLTLEDTDNKLQGFWNVGLSYAF